MSTYLFVGDSIVCADRYDTDDNLGNGFVRMISERLLPDSDHCVVNRGYDGFTVTRMLRQKHNLAECKPDVITVLIGINDVCEHIYAGGPDAETFMSRMRELVQTWKRAGSRIIILGPFLFPEPEEHLNWMGTLEEFQKKLRLVSCEEELTYIPLGEIFEIALKEKSVAEFTVDGIHPSERGHRVIADVWIEKILHNKNQT